MHLVIKSEFLEMSDSVRANAHCNVVLVIQVLKLQRVVLFEVGLVVLNDSGVWDFSWDFSLRSRYCAGSSQQPENCMKCNFDNERLPILIHRACDILPYPCRGL